MEEHGKRRGSCSSKLAEHPLRFLIGKGSKQRHQHGEPAGIEARTVGDKVGDDCGLQSV